MVWDHGIGENVTIRQVHIGFSQAWIQGVMDMLRKEIVVDLLRQLSTLDGPELLKVRDVLLSREVIKEVRDGG